MQPSEYEGGHAHTAKAMVGIYCASNDYTEAYIEAYRAFRCAPKKVGEQDEEKLFEVVSRLRELVAHCTLYLREHPQEEESIELVIDELVMKRDEEEEASDSSSSVRPIHRSAYTDPGY